MKVKQDSIVRVRFCICSKSCHYDETFSPQHFGNEPTNDTPNDPDTYVARVGIIYDFHKKLPKYRGNKTTVNRFFICFYLAI